MTLLNYRLVAKGSADLSSVLWYDDTTGRLDKIDTDNVAFVKKQKATTNKKVDSLGYLFVDVLNMDRFLISEYVLICSLGESAVNTNKFLNTYFAF